MFVAHFPSGYLASRVFRSRAATVSCVIGSVLPDADLIWWWLVDERRVHHHDYWTHLPVFWTCLAACVLAFERHKMVVAFFVGVASHLVLDTFVGDIKWLVPLSDRYFHVVEVPRRPGGGHWVWSFVLHWTFLVELALVATAAVWYARLRPARARRRS